MFSSKDQLGHIYATRDNCTGFSMISIRNCIIIPNPELQQEFIFSLPSEGVDAFFYVSNCEIALGVKSTVAFYGDIPWFVRFALYVQKIVSSKQNGFIKLSHQPVN